MRWHCYVYSFTFCFLTLFSHGQTKRIDSLKQLIRSASSSPEKLTSILALCERRQSLNTDTFCRYASMAKELAGSMHDSKKLEWSDFYIACCMARKGELDGALKIFDETLAKIHYDDADGKLFVKLSLQKGQAFIKSNQYKEALTEFYKLLGKAEERHDTLAQLYTKTSIGWVNMEIGKNSEALEWFYKALQTSNEKDLQSYGVIYSNMAATYNELNKNDSAAYYIDKAINITRRSEDLQFLANALAIQADIYTDTKRNDLAEKSLNEALEIRKQIGDPYYVVSDITQLAIFYAGSNQTDKGIKICKEGIEMATKHNLVAKLPILYNALAENYKVAGMYKQYGETLQQVVSLKDSLYEKNSAGALAEMQAKYEAQKNENIIEQQKFDLQKNDFIFYGVIALLIFGIIIILILFNGFRKRQQLQMRMMLEKEKDTSILAVAKAEENERKRIAADLHDNLGAYAASIASNIDHITNKRENGYDSLALQELRNNSKDMVSQLSDTIWALKKDALQLTAISDRVKIFIQRIQASYPRIKMEVIENITTDHLLPPSQAFHLFQVAKESVINALKHSGCKEIIVMVEGNETWRIMVNDDGKGIDTGDIKSNGEGGNGIFNMRARAEESGWKIEWINDAISGTSVVVSPTTN